MPTDDITVTIEDARLIYKNFSGVASQYNVNGDRTFCVLLDKAIAEKMAADGWNIKQTNPREEGDDPMPYIEVKVSFKFRPPRITLITSVNRTVLKEDDLSIIDDADIKLVDLIIRANQWTVNGKTGLKAYLQTMFVTINEDPLMRKYALMDGGE